MLKEQPNSTDICTVDDSRKSRKERPGISTAGKRLATIFSTAIVALGIVSVTPALATTTNTAPPQATTNAVVQPMAPYGPCSFTEWRSDSTHIKIFVSGHDAYLALGALSSGLYTVSVAATGYLIDEQDISTTYGRTDTILASPGNHVYVTIETPTHTTRCGGTFSA